MAKIKGRFAPLTDELGDDERFIIKSTDLDKLLYVLVIYTCHMTRHKAPKDPLFYKRRYGLRAKTGQIAASLGRLQGLYPAVSWGDKNLSLLNSVTYEPKILTEEEREQEKEREQKPPVFVSHETKQELEKDFDQLEAFLKLWEKYPVRGRLKRSASLRFYCQTVMSAQVAANILTALDNYSAHLKANDWKTPQELPNWLESWPDWENHKEHTEEKPKRAHDPNCSSCNGTGFWEDPNRERPKIKCLQT